MSTNPHDPTIRRAALPEIMFVPDVALATGTGDSAARKAIVRGDYGPYFRVGRRLAVLHESFIAALKAREIEPGLPQHAAKPPRPNRKFVEMLENRRGRRRR